MTQKYESETDSNRVTIIGAGIVGLCTALELQDRGRDVSIIDRLNPAEATSFGNAGMLCTWSVVPQATPGIWKSAPKWLLDPEGPLVVRPKHAAKMVPWLWRFVQSSRKSGPVLAADADAMMAVNQPTVPMYQQYLAGTGHESLVRESDFLHLYRNPANLDPNGIAITLREERGAPIEILDANALHDLVPALSKVFNAAIRLGGQGYTINPGRLGKVLAEKVLRQGGEIVRDEILNCLPIENGFRLTTVAGEHVVNRLVIAAGAWSHRLTEQLGTTMPLAAERGYHVVFPNPGVDVPMPLSDAERHIGITPMEMGLRVAGTAEFADVDADPNYRRADVLKKLARDALPGLNEEGADYWMGPRPSFPDTVPVISALPGQPNAWVACGHGHLGLTGAPMTGRLIAAMVDGDRTDVDLGPYRADRFR